LFTNHCSFEKEDVDLKSSPKVALERMTTLARVWRKLRPTRTFSGLALEQYEEIIRPCLEARAELAGFDDSTRATAARRDEADAVGTATVKRIINAIKGDPHEGEHGEVYAALGYTRPRVRAAGRRVGTDGVQQLSEQVKPEDVKPAEEAKKPNTAT
jgi:hypothetical protein